MMTASWQNTKNRQPYNYPKVVVFLKTYWTIKSPDLGITELDDSKCMPLSCKTSGPTEYY